MKNALILLAAAAGVGLVATVATDPPSHSRDGRERGARCPLWSDPWIECLAYRPG
jgi:hypothetical protein